MPIKPYSARHTSDDLGDTLRIKIPSHKQWFVILFIGIWIGGWALGVSIALGGLLSGQDFESPSLFSIAWLGIWIAGGGFAIYVLSWQLFGYEVIDVSGQGITANRVVLGLGFPKEYSIEHIKALRVSTAVSSSDMFGWSRIMQFYGIGGGLIAFDYGSKTIHIGRGIEEAEAKQVLAEINKRFPQYLQIHDRD